MNQIIRLPHAIDVDAQLRQIEKRKCELSLVEFIKAAWHVIEPGQPYVHSWHVNFLAEHLTAITDGIQFDDGTYYNRLLANVPPGTSKSVIVNIFWPAWEWGPRNMPHLRYVCAAHAQHLALRDSIRMRRLVSSEWYQGHWGDRVQLVKDQNQVSKFENTATGFRQASAAGSITGARGDRVILDDPLSVEDGMSATVLESTKNWFLEAVPTRLNNPDRSAIVVIMQRLHECLLPGTLVRTPDGEAAIETLRVGDTVYGSDGWQQIEWAGSRPYSGTAYGIRLHGHLTTSWTTDNHLYLTEDGWKRADTITKADWVRLPIPETGMIDVPWDEPLRADVPGFTGSFSGARPEKHKIDVDELKALVYEGLTVTEIGKRLGAHRNTIQCHMSMHGLTRLKHTNSFKDESHLKDPMFWRFIGYWLAEGSCSKGGIVKLTFGDDEPEYVDECMDILTKYGLYCARSYAKSVRAVTVCSSQLESWLTKHFDKGSHRLRLPEFVYALPRHLREEVMEGWLRGDGCIRADGQRSGASVSLALIHSMQRLASSLGIRSMVVGVRGQPRANIIDGKHSVSCGVSYEVRLNWNSKIESRNKSKIEKDALWYRVMSIDTKPYDGLVYDITTPSHDFVVGNATVHNSDTSGVILDMDLGYDHVMLPMRYEASRNYPTKLGYIDPRTEEGELLFPERFPEHVVAELEKSLGTYGASGQLQQAPVPRGGGIIKPHWWQLWEEKNYPPIEYIIMTLDTAYTEKQENDPSGLIVWGVFSQRTDTVATRQVDRYGKQIEVSYSKYGSDLGPTPKVMMMYAWTDHFQFHELVQHVAKVGIKYKVDEILIENKAAGHSVAQELRRLFHNEDFAVRMYDPKTLDKSARLYSVQHIFEEGMVYAPDKDWAESVIRQVSSFPKGKHDEFADCTSMGIKSLRDRGFLTRSAERHRELEEDSRFKGNSGNSPLYVA